MNSVTLGNPLFKKHNVTIGPKNNLLQLPDLTVQLNQILPEKGKKRLHKEIIEEASDEKSTNCACGKYFQNVVWRNFLTSINLVPDLLFLETA